MTTDDDRLKTQLAQREAAMNDMFGRLQARDAEIISLSNERGRLYNKIEELNRRIKKLERREAVSETVMHSVLNDNAMLRDSLRSAKPVILDVYGEEAAAAIDAATDPSGIAVVRFMEFLQELWETDWAKEVVQSFRKAEPEVTGVKEKVA